MNLQRKPLEFYNLIKKKVNDEEVFHSFSMDDKNGNCNTILSYSRQASTIHKGYIGLSFVIIHMNLYKNKEHIKNVRQKRN